MIQRHAFGSSSLYVLALESLLQESVRRITWDLGDGRTVSESADDEVVLNSKHRNLVGTVLQEYEAMTGTKINLEKLVSLQLVPGKASPCRP